MKDRINWIGFITIIMIAMVFGLIGYSLPTTINFINRFDEGAFYGYYASYIISMLLFYIFARDIKLTIKRESYMRFFIKNYSKKK